MRRLILAAALVVAAAPAAAQDAPPARERSRTFTFSIGPDEFQLDMRRGRMGILVDLSADAARDSVGARVAGVTPGGAADRAGVRTGDLVVRFNGTRLASSAAGRGEDDDDDQSRPGLRLIRIASRLDPGDTVRLELRRDGRPLTVTFQAEESDMDRVMTRLRLPDLRGVMPGIPGEGSERMRMFAFGGAGLSDLELVKVNPQLAEGLGISEGLLVVDVGSDTVLGLRAGDVITSIGGRRPTSPAHAMRVLATYDANEAVQFEVMRQRRRQTVNGHMPAARGWRVEPNSLPRIRIEGPKRIRVVNEA